MISVKKVRRKKWLISKHNILTSLRKCKRRSKGNFKLKSKMIGDGGQHYLVLK